MRWPLTRPPFDAARDGRLERVAQQFAVAETPVPVLRERGRVRDAVAEIQAAEPTTGEVEIHLLAEPPPGRSMRFRGPTGATVASHPKQ